MTANPELGETKVVIGGVPYVLAMTFNSMIALQQMFERNGEIPRVETVLQRAQDGDLFAFRAVFWTTLRRHHPALTIDQAGDLIDAAGGVNALDAMIQRVQAGSGPDEEDRAAVGGAANPPKAAKATRRRGRTGGRLT